MSEILEKLRGITTLPLFPLPLVLYPGEILPLHIFEERYRQMLRDIQVGNGYFGVIFYDPEETDSDLPELTSVGCLAEIRESQTLEDGRSNIVTLGVSRFYVDDYVDGMEPYAVAKVTFFSDYEDDDDLIQTTADHVFGLFKRVAKAAHEMSGQLRRFAEIPQADPEPLSFLIAAIFNLPNRLKYELLQTRSTLERLQKLREILTQAVAQIEESAALHNTAKTNGHSKKKIDFN